MRIHEEIMIAREQPKKLRIAKISGRLTILPGKENMYLSMALKNEKSFNSTLTPVSLKTLSLPRVRVILTTACLEAK